MSTEPPGGRPPTIPAMHHVALTVADLDRSAGWYEQVLGVERDLVQETPQRRAIIYRFPGGRLFFGLVQHGEAGTSTFDPTSVGLDTAAFSTSTRAELETWVDRFDRYGVTHSGITDVAFGAMLNFVDPDGIQLAIFWER